MCALKRGLSYHLLDGVFHVGRRQPTVIFDVWVRARLVSEWVDVRTSERKLHTTDQIPAPQGFSANCP